MSLRYAKRGRLRFASHRDFARAFERALRRADLPVAYSGGFTPHPRVSYMGAAPTGVASEAEYLELGLTRDVAPELVRDRLDAVLPEGFDILDAVVAGDGKLVDRLTGSRWRVVVPGVAPEALADALEAFLAADEVLVTRLTKSGRKNVDVRAPVVVANATQRGSWPGDRDEEPDSAILELVVRHTTPTVRPDDLLSGIAAVAGLDFPDPARATRVAQGTVQDDGTVGDPLHQER